MFPLQIWFHTPSIRWPMLTTHGYYKIHIILKIVVSKDKDTRLANYLLFLCCLMIGWNHLFLHSLCSIRNFLCQLQSLLWNQRVYKPMIVTYKAAKVVFWATSYLDRCWSKTEGTKVTCNEFCENWEIPNSLELLGSHTIGKLLTSLNMKINNHQSWPQNLSSNITDVQLRNYLKSAKMRLCVCPDVHMDISGTPLPMIIFSI